MVIHEYTYEAFDSAVKFLFELWAPVSSVDYILCIVLYLPQGCYVQYGGFRSIFSPQHVVTCQPLKEAFILCWQWDSAYYSYAKLGEGSVDNALILKLL